MPESKSVTKGEIPSCLLPLARQVIRRGGSACRVSGKRRCRHHYHVSVRTKRLKKELAPVARLFEAPDTAKRTRKPGRGCAA